MTDFETCIINSCMLDQPIMSLQDMWVCHHPQGAVPQQCGPRPDYSP